MGTPIHCQKCRQELPVPNTTGQVLVCPVCGEPLPRAEVEGTVDCVARDPQDSPIDGTVDMRTNPLDAAASQNEGDKEEKPLRLGDNQPTDGRAESTIDVTIDHVAGKTPSSAELERLEKTLEQFEELWKTGRRPSIMEFLVGDEGRAELLIELTHLDLSYRLKAGEDARVEQYLEQFPELKQDRNTVIELVLTEFRLRGQHGSEPDLEAFVQRFPEFADDLTVLLKRPPRSRRRWFPIRLNCPHCHNAIAVVDSEDDHEVVCPSCHSSFRLDPDRTQTWEPEALPMVGRFQLLRMLGRGAFGTVYQAKDTTLNRLVALKIPRSGTFSSRGDEDRFVSEAEHAAQLNHAGIVQVYDVGRTDDYPYIVTEFVRGVTLSDVLTARRFDFSQAARLVATIADALHHAHEHQVIHRDLKPANIMIDVDETPRVMDFGLAKRHVAEITVALDGSILGTPAYMSPEQASGQSQSADRRSDVYSLGVILFELLSGERPFRGNSVMLLHQVAHAEAPKLRHLNDKIPLDLETIAAKCLEKDRAKRYQSAKELGDDLRRHLNHEPIQARPIGRMERAGRWCKRNPLLVKSAATVFATLVLALFVVSLFWRSESIQRHEAEIAKKDALDRLGDARQATDLWLTVFPHQLQELPGGPQVLEQFLLQAAGHYEKFANQQSDDPQLELERGRSWLRLGDVRRELEQLEGAHDAYEQAAEIFSDVAGGRSQVEPAEVTAELGTAWLGMGLVLKDLGQLDEAAQRMVQTISALTEQLRDNDHDPRLQEVLAASQVDLAALQFKTGQVTQSEATVLLAVASYTELCKRPPETPDGLPEPRFRLGLATAESLLGQVLAQSGENEDARETFRRAIQCLDDLISADGSRDAEEFEYLRARAEKRVMLASVLRSLGDTEAELKAYDESAADYARLERARPGVPAIQYELAILRINKGNLLQHLNRSPEAEQPLRDAIVMFHEFATVFGQLEYHNKLAACRSMLGEVYRDLAKYEDSEQLLRSAVTTYEDLTNAAPDNLEYIERRAVANWQLGQTLAAVEQMDAAAEVLRTAIADFDLLMKSVSDVPAYMNAAAYASWHLGEATRSLSPGEANAAFERAIDLWDELQATAPSPKNLNNFAWFLVTCAEPQWHDGERAVQLAERALKLQPANDRYQITLGGAYYRQGDLTSCEETLSQLADGSMNGAGQFFLAMSLAKQGQLAEARQRYDAGEAWLLEHQPGNRLLQHLRQEANSVIEEAADAASLQ